ncbi:MAG: MarR family transcriptional regulator [Xenophilus sp.]
MTYDHTQRFGFLVNQVARLHGAHFDRLARERLGLSLAQCRLIGALVQHQAPLSQAELAQRLELSAMGVAALCDRMEAAGWIRREASTTDRRVKWVHPEPRALAAFEEALRLGDEVQAHGLSHLSAAERRQLIVLLRKASDGLLAWAPGTALTGEQA